MIREMDKRCADGAGYLAGRTGARLHGLDSFSGDDIEILVKRAKRNIQTPHRVCSTGCHSASSTP